MKGFVAAVAVVVTAGVVSGVAAAELTIRLAPGTLVLSSQGGSFTIHTDTPYLSNGNEVQVTVDGVALAMDSVFPDNRGNLVAQTSKDAVAAVLAEFSGTRTTALVEITANGGTGSGTLVVKK